MEGWRRNLYVVWFATFASVTGGSFVQPFLPLFINRDLGVTDPATAAIWFGLATTGSGACQAILAPIWGILADRHGRKMMVVRAQFAIGAANAGMSFVGSPWQLVGLRSIQGMFSGVVGASRALVASTVPREKVPFAMGLIQSSIFMGQTLGPTMGGILGSAIGFRGSFLATASINVVAGILAAIYVKERPLERGPGRSGRDRGSLREMLRSRPLAILFVTFFLISVANQLARPILPLLLQEIDPDHDVAFTSGVAFSVLGISGAISSVLASRDGGRFGLRSMVVASALLGAVSSYVVSLAPTPAMVLGCLFFVGLSQGALVSSSTALISLFAPASRQGTVFGMLTSSQSLAQGAGPITGGLLASFADLRVPFVAAGVVLALAGMLILAVPAPPITTESELLAS